MITNTRPAPPTGTTPPAGGGRHLSVPRAVLAIILIGAAGYFGVNALTTSSSTTTRRLAQPWFAPYVDATLPPTYPFEDQSSNPARSIVLGFVVADPASVCTPSWGAQNTPGNAATALDLDRRIARLRTHGADAVVSFGGAANTELANACQNQAALTAAYQSVVDRYKLRTIDLDIEGVALNDAGSIQRRAVAMKALQDRATRAGGHLAVWLTLPVTPAGLPAKAASLVDTMLVNHVEIAGVNALTMNYGGSRDRGDDMITASEKALNATHLQVQSAYRLVGTELTSQAAWAKVGATPMIGQNNVVGEIFSLSDARQLLDFRAQHGLGRISMWNLNRDTPCGPNVSGDDVVLRCTGLKQSALSFTRLFSSLPGRPAKPVSAGGSKVARVPVDNPATSPYPIWRQDSSYPKGSKIVWHGNVFQAKWYTQGDFPDAPVAHDYQTPWQLIGPVLPGEGPASLKPLPEGTFPDWLFYRQYLTGARVLYKGQAYQARYYTQGDVPDVALNNPGGSPWEHITP